MPALNQTADPVSVLVVDDDVDTAESLAELLAFHGHTVRVALGGASALLQVEAECPDVVLLDLCMPRLDGSEVARLIRERCEPPQKRPILVAITGYPLETGHLRPARSQFDLTLVKPVAPDVIVAILARFQQMFGPRTTRPNFNSHADTDQHSVKALVTLHVGR